MSTCKTGLKSFEQVGFFDFRGRFFGSKHLEGIPGHWCRLRGECGHAGGNVGDGAEERAAFVLSVGVEVVALHPGSCASNSWLAFGGWAR